eukprot:TRINITY_DN10537_c0_g1_i1.p1 TRINITY_DN10537_c0_g1~~TRINITY_DN10537_c0_g1_i1.p1  ORF type:complete len:189 (+),score=22.36 TRINITY_DN10537_c0_g1_i1:64-630(+)
MCIRDRYQRRVHGKGNTTSLLFYKSVECGRNRTICRGELSLIEWQKDLYFNVGVDVVDLQSMERARVFYNQTKVLMEPRRFLGFEFVIFGCVAIILVLSVGLWGLLRKYKKTKALLRYELQDVRNVARLSEGQQIHTLCILIVHQGKISCYSIRYPLRPSYKLKCSCLFYCPFISCLLYTSPSPRDQA